MKTFWALLALWAANNVVMITYEHVQHRATALRQVGDAFRWWENVRVF